MAEEDEIRRLRRENEHLVHDVSYLNEYEIHIECKINIDISEI